MLSLQGLNRLTFNLQADLFAGAAEDVLGHARVRPLVLHSGSLDLQAAVDVHAVVAAVQPAAQPVLKPARGEKTQRRERGNKPPVGRDGSPGGVTHQRSSGRGEPKNGQSKKVRLFWTTLIRWVLGPSILGAMSTGGEGDGGLHLHLCLGPQDLSHSHTDICVSPRTLTKALASR